MFDRIFVPAPLREVLSDEAWLQAFLDVERGLALAEASAGLIPETAAAEIAEACRAERFDAAALADEGRAPGNPVEPLVRGLREAVGDAAADHVHQGATSQDILDTAAMLVTRAALDLVLESLDAVAAETAALADRHRSTAMVGRTLLQQAEPTTFGLKAAGWLLGVLDAHWALTRVREERLVVQLGGAAGTLAALGDAGPEVMKRMAEELSLGEPAAPWHTNRVRIGELGASLALTAGAVAKVGIDIGLLSQNEVGEVSEANPGVSSAMPHKRNPIGSVLAVACARQAQAQAAVLVSSLVQEHERAFGAWHAEWPALVGALGYTGGAVEAGRRALDGLEVHEERMQANLAASGLGSELGSAETFVDQALEVYRAEVG
jgi:3-carboxy-cis,cis-muconate cycloisomerase